jgi:raffinose/stachyose/melibiose transport system substrate-binding protein
MKRKVLGALLATAMIMGLLAGCGKSDDTQTTSGTGTPLDNAPAATSAASTADASATTMSDGTVDPFGYKFVDKDVATDLTVFRYYADSDKVNLDYAIAKMKEKYPNLKINMEHRTDSDGSTLRTRAAVGELPDIFEINAADVHKTLKEDGTLYQVDKEVADTGFYNLFSNGAAVEKARTASDGHQYAFGCEVSNLGELWYNKQLFADLGIKEPTNYDEFKHTIEVLKKAGKVPVALFAAEKWPATSLFSLASIAEGQPKGLDAVNDGEAKITDDVYKKAADKLVEISNLGAFGKGALSTNYQQAYEMMYSGDAGYFLSGAWYFLTLEADGKGNAIDYCKYNVFANDDVKETVRWNALGGYQTEAKYSVNAKPPCGLDAAKVTYFGLEMEYWTRVSAGVSGSITTVKGDFNFTGGQGYSEYYKNYGNYKTFTNFTGDLSNGDFVSAADNACEMVISGNYKTGAELIKDIASSGF